MWYGEAKRIYIVALGKKPEALLEALKDAVGETFGKETLIDDELSPPLFAYSPERRQCNSTLILERLAGMKADGMVLAVTEADLYAFTLNFVFGEADPVEGVAVISLARLREEFYGKEPDWRLLLQRAEKEAVHEAGHLYGLSHCPDARCVMHFSNSLEDTDFKGRGLCDFCRERLSEAAIP